MRIRDTLSSESEHVKSRAPGLQWRDVRVRRRRSGSRDDDADDDAGWSGRDRDRNSGLGAKQYEYTSYEMPDHSVLSYVTFIPYAITHSLRNMAKGNEQ